MKVEYAVTCYDGTVTVGQFNCSFVADATKDLIPHLERQNLDKWQAIELHIKRDERAS